MDFLTCSHKVTSRMECLFHQNVSKGDCSFGTCMGNLLTVVTYCKTYKH